jgi:glycosyltransferase involved in cell wall biosynthesis
MGLDNKRHVRLVHVVSDAMSYSFFKGQLAFMQEQGFDVIFVATPSKRLEEVENDGIPVFGIKMLRKISIVSDLVAVWEMFWFLKKVRPDIVHSHTPKGGLIGTIGAWLACVPIRIYHIRGLPFMGAVGVKQWVLKMTERISCACANQVLSVSHSIKDVAVLEKICKKSKIRVILNGSGNGVAAISRFNPTLFSVSDRKDVRGRVNIPENATILGFVGRIVKDKGIYELLETFTRIYAKHNDVYLLIIGMLEDGDPISDTDRILMYEHPNIRFVGEQRDLPSWYQIIDIVVFPTYREGFPNVPLEAASMQIPIVASDIPGCRDAIVSNDTGILVPVKKIDSFVEATESYIKDKNLRLTHGKNARKRVLTQFDQHVLWEAYAHLYMELLKRPQ